MSLSPSNRELLAAVRAWVAANYPGCTLDYISIHFMRGASAIRPVELADDLCSALVETPADPTHQDEDERVDDDGIPLCIKDILTTMHEVRQPLTLTVLKKQMAKRGFKWHERTLKKYLAVLMEDETVENPEGARPPGYRLTCPELLNGE